MRIIILIFLFFSFNAYAEECVSINTDNMTVTQVNFILPSAISIAQKNGGYDSVGNSNSRSIVCFNNPHFNMVEKITRQAILDEQVIRLQQEYTSNSQQELERQEKIDDFKNRHDFTDEDIEILKQLINGG